MRYRKIVTNKIESLEGNLKTLRRMVQRGEPITEFIKVIDQAEEKLNQVQEYIQKEPTRNDEIL